ARARHGALRRGAVSRDRARADHRGRRATAGRRSEPAQHDGHVMPAVSVIMPAFNAEHYLHVAVESVLRQTFADLELVIVDDGSSDRTVAVAQQHAAGDS